MVHNAQVGLAAMRAEHGFRVVEDRCVPPVQPPVWPAYRTQQRAAPTWAGASHLVMPEACFQHDGQAGAARRGRARGSVQQSKINGRRKPSGNEGAWSQRDNIYRVVKIFCSHRCVPRFRLD